MPPRTFNYSSRKNPRNCGPKVKSGCRTCKIRHVKCDEQKPECQKCKGTGRKCDYVDTRKAIEYLDTRNVAISTPGNDQERRQFAFFTTHTAHDLNGYFDEGFWSRLVLQVSFQVPALRHAVVALASLHESFKDGEQVQKQGGTQNTFAIKQYSKALGSLRKDLADGKATSLVTVMACVIFISFDSLRREFDTALVHLRSGMQLIRDLLNKKTLSSSDAYFIRKSILPLFKRLWVQAIFFIDIKSLGAFDKPWMDWIHNTTVPTTSFTTLEDARATLIANMDTTLHFYYTLEESKRLAIGVVAKQIYIKRVCMSNADPPLTSPPSDGFIPITWEIPKVKTALPQVALSRWNSLISSLDEWEEKFNAIIKSKTSNLSSTELRAATLLKIHHVLVEVILKTSFRQPGFDGNPFARFTHRFEQALQLCRSLIASEKAASTDAKVPSSTPGEGSNPPIEGYSSFSSDLGLIGPLYFIAMKCTVSHLRWEAVSLLQMSKRREGMWDSELTASICVRIINLEEKSQNPNTHFRPGSDESDSSDATNIRTEHPVANPRLVQDSAAAAPTESVTVDSSEQSAKSGWKSWKWEWQEATGMSRIGEGEDIGDPGKHVCGNRVTILPVSTLRSIAVCQDHEKAEDS